ncbi:MAG: hypothetical protein WC283_02055 [Candidatus Paceibacterota bacterium]|jgi:hypothetical protein
MKSSKVKYVTASAQIIGDILKRAVKNKLPKDAEVLRVNYNILTNNYELVIYSEEYENVPEGAMIPKLDEPLVSEDVLK